MPAGADGSIDSFVLQNTASTEAFLADRHRKAAEAAAVASFVTPMAAETALPTLMACIGMPSVPVSAVLEQRLTDAVATGPAEATLVCVENHTNEWLTIRPGSAAGPWLLPPVQPPITRFCTSLGSLFEQHTPAQAFRVMSGCSPPGSRR